MSTFFELVSQNSEFIYSIFILFCGTLKGFIKVAKVFENVHVPQRNLNVKMYDNFFLWLSHKALPI